MAGYAGTTALEGRTLCVDIDATICASRGPGDYAGAEPLPGAIEALASLRRRGWIIVLHTARHFNHWHTTVTWLSAHGFEYDQLVFGKPPARWYIDDKAVAFDGNWSRVVKRLSSGR